MSFAPEVFAITLTVVAFRAFIIAQSLGCLSTNAVTICPEVLLNLGLFLSH